jgi:DNA-binding transcriptional LysR family regulator
MGANPYILDMMMELRHLRYFLALAPEPGCFYPAVTRTLLEFRQACPVLHVTLQENNSTKLVVMIREGTVDAAFIRPPFERDELVAYAHCCKRKW